MRAVVAALVLVLALPACGPELQEDENPGEDDVPRDIYMAFDVRYPQGSTPDQVTLVWGLEVALAGSDDERDLGWCEAEAARQVAEYGAVIVTECAPVAGLWCVPASRDCRRTAAECGAGCAFTDLG